jgi:acyl-CoA synthetase (AMP-forming)/AMP-acid ligase II
MTSTSSSPDLVLERFSENCSKYAAKTLFSFLSPGLDGGRIQKSYTYAAFETESSDLAQRLLESGLKRGDRALLVYPPSLEFMMAFLACLKAGVVAVPGALMHFLHRHYVDCHNDKKISYSLMFLI